MSPLYQIFGNRMQQPVPSAPQPAPAFQNPIMNRFQAFGDYIGQFQEFARNFNSNFGNQNPKDIVQNLINSGQMSQEDFSRLSAIANSFMGIK